MQRLKDWFLEARRDLPWRKSKTPYRVWISEVMLQQTQVSVVIPYYRRWLEKFPTVQDLAQASLEEVMKAWEGLGYYSRARNLHRAAQKIVAEFQGELPTTPEALSSLPGFGPYTTGAVLSFAFEKKAAAVDGNVVRVLSRLTASDQDCTQRKHYEALALSVLPDQEPWVVMEALIELGAQVCLRTPKCQECPLIEECRAYREGVTGQFPIKKKRPETIYLKRHVAVLRCKEQLLVRQEKEKKVMAGLYEFPYVPWGERLPFDIAFDRTVELPLVKHGFTKYDVTLYPMIYEAIETKPIVGYEWKSWSELGSLPFSSGHRRILEILSEYFTY